MPFAPGSRLGPYAIRATLGAGGMGTVYRAHDSRLARDVAIKVLPENVARDAESLARFTREARAVAALNHPHIVTIHSTEDADGITSPWCIRRSATWTARSSCSSWACAITTDGLAVPECRCSRTSAVIRATRSISAASAIPTPNGHPRLDNHAIARTLAIAVMVFQFRVVAGSPKRRSSVPR
jgi:serine/threonine protein kinase